jgi:hypothetical protein
MSSIVVLACLLITPEIIKDGFCYLKDDTMIFVKDQFRLTYAVGDCEINKEDKGVRVKYGDQILQQVQIRCK